GDQSRQTLGRYLLSMLLPVQLQEIEPPLSKGLRDSVSPATLLLAPELISASITPVVTVTLWTYSPVMLPAAARPAEALSMPVKSPVLAYSSATAVLAPEASELASDTCERAT